MADENIIVNEQDGQSTSVLYAEKANIEVFPYTRQDPIFYKKEVTNPDGTTSITYITEDEYNKLTDSDKTSYAPNYPRDGRVLSEENIALLIGSLTDFKNFVIANNCTDDKTRYIEFILAGRYFKIIENSPFELLGDQLWVKAIIDSADTSSIKGYDTLEGWSISDDKTSIQFKGLEFKKSLDNKDDHNEWFQLLEIIGGKLQVPIASQFKFTSRSIENINGGTV